MGTDPDQSTIAILDDDVSFREALSGFVRSLGYAARPFNSAQDFLQSAATARCLILDVTMPDMDGLELQSRLRAMGRAVPVIFVTASQEQCNRTRALEAGAVAFMGKPFNRDEFVQHLLSILDHPSPLA